MSVVVKLNEHNDWRTVIAFSLPLVVANFESAVSVKFYGFCIWNLFIDLLTELHLNSCFICLGLCLHESAYVYFVVTFCHWQSKLKDNNSKSQRLTCP